MEKLSLYDLLSVLLPGALLTLIIEVIAVDVGLDLGNLKTNQYFRLTIFLSSSIFLGSFINISTRLLLKLYKKIKLFIPIYKIYKESKSIKQLKPFYKKMLTAVDVKLLEKDTLNQRMEHIWSEIYYELEATDRIKTPKAFQSFYFFFRNFFTLSLFLFIPLLVLLIVKWVSYKYSCLFAINLIAGILSIFASKWYRERMVERMFWTYYSLNKKTKS